MLLHVLHQPNSLVINKLIMPIVTHKGYAMLGRYTVRQPMLMQQNVSSHCLCHGFCKLCDGWLHAPPCAAP